MLIKNLSILLASACCGCDCRPQPTSKECTLIIHNETTNVITVTLPAKVTTRIRAESGLPDNVLIKSDGVHFCWVDTNPNRLWDSTLKHYGLHTEFNTYEEALSSARRYVEAMNADASEGARFSRMDKLPEVK